MFFSHIKRIFRGIFTQIEWSYSKGRNDRLEKLVDARSKSFIRIRAYKGCPTWAEGFAALKRLCSLCVYIYNEMYVYAIEELPKLFTERNLHRRTICWNSFLFREFIAGEVLRMQNRYCLLYTQYPHKARQRGVTEKINTRLWNRTCRNLSLARSVPFYYFVCPIFPRFFCHIQLCISLTFNKVGSDSYECVGFEPSEFPIFVRTPWIKCI